MNEENRPQQPSKRSGCLAVLVFLMLLAFLIPDKEEATNGPNITPEKPTEKLNIKVPAQIAVFGNGRSLHPLEPYDKPPQTDIKGLSAKEIVNKASSLYRGGNHEDKEEAIRLLRKAAEMGEVDAQLDLGALYIKGENVPLDYGESLRWFHAAAKQGVKKANLAINTFYQEMSRLRGAAMERGEIRILRSETTYDIYYKSQDPIINELNWCITEKAEKMAEKTIDFIEGPEELGKACWEPIKAWLLSCALKNEETKNCNSTINRQIYFTLMNKDKKS